MPIQFTKKTDTEHVETLETQVISVGWLQANACPGGTAEFEVLTALAGQGTPIEVKGQGSSGAKLPKVEAVVVNDAFRGTIRIPDDAQVNETLTLEAKLTKAKAEGTSTPIPVVPRPDIRDLKWGQKTAARGDVVHLSAAVGNVNDGDAAVIHVYEHDQDGAHDPVMDFPVTVRNGKVETDWEFQYVDDTDDLKSQGELEPHEAAYSPPSFFFTVECRGLEMGRDASSKLLEFQDVLEFTLTDGKGSPLAKAKVEIETADGTKQEVESDDDGRIELVGIAPGPVRLKLIDPGSTPSDDDPGDEDDAEEDADTGDAAVATSDSKTRYALRVRVVTRQGEVPLRNVRVEVNGSELGRTDDEGVLAPSDLRDDAALDVSVVYGNEDEKLRSEVFTIRLDDLSADDRSCRAGQARNLIAKVVDVLGTGSSALGGDQDFDDTYDLPAGDLSFVDHDDGENGRIELTVRMATISLDVPYANQNAGSERVTLSNGNASAAYAGSRICMPTCGSMLTGYWGADETRRDVMQACYDADEAITQDMGENAAVRDQAQDRMNAAAAGGRPAPWQWWTTMRAALENVLDGVGGEAVTLEAFDRAGEDAPSDPQTVPSDFADDVAACLGRGEPMMCSVRHRSGGSHIIACRGAVVDSEGRTQWLIFNDPYGNMASPGSVYGELDLEAPVGLRGTSDAERMNLRGDVEAVQAALRAIGDYDGPVDGVCDETDPDDPTAVAIRAYQGRRGDGRVDPGFGTERRLNAGLSAHGGSANYRGREGEINGEDGSEAERGRHVYYSGSTEGGGADGHLIWRPQYRFVTVGRDPAFTPDEVAERLVPGD